MTPADRLAQARATYVLAARDGRGGKQVQADFAGAVDRLIEDVTAAVPGLAASSLVVCALGGYGRNSLCLHSDLDLLLLFERPLSTDDERGVGAVLQPLWDLGLTIGHQVRELADLATPDLTNIEFLLALLDARHVAGGVPLFERLRAWIGSTIRGSHAREVLVRLLEAIATRHATFNDTIYQLEPDIKNAPGGLRDIVAIRHLGLLQPDLLALDTDRSLRQLDAADEALARIRSLLHVERRRDVNQLTHELQEDVAARLHVGGDHPRQRVEAMMGTYFRDARAVSRALQRRIRAVAPANHALAPQPIGRHFEIADDGVGFSDPLWAADRPALWLELFRVALAHRCRVAEAALTLIEDAVDERQPDDFLATDADRQRLLSMLRPAPGLYARLSEMHDCGLLNRIFPEFARIQSRVIRDFHHKYTVDEHTLLAIRGLEKLRAPKTPGRERFTSLLDELHRPELLSLALLFHDVGKWKDAEHAPESVRLSQAALDRLELTGADREMVEFLIRDHLRMSQVAFRRDLDDLAVVSEFAALAGTEERLKMLTLLTFADVGAVSPDTLTPWKEELLWRLYVSAYNRLTLGYADDLLLSDPAGLAVVVAGRPDDISEDEVSLFLNGLPRRYLTLFGLTSIYRHVRLARGLALHEVHAELERHDDAWELSLVTLDQPFLFSNISGVLAYYGMDIHRGQAMTTPTGVVLDVFRFSDDEAFLRKNPGAKAEIIGMLEGVVAGTVDVPTRLKGKLRSLLYASPRRTRPLVRFDGAHSRKYTVIELTADDAPGLLHRVSRVISRCGYGVDLVLIATEGKKAIDVLHITRQGKRLTESEQAALGAELLRMLEEDTYEAR